MALRTDYKDDILDLTQNAQRKYRMITNSDGTVSFTDVTAYSQVGDSFGAADLNALALAISENSGNIDYFPDEDMVKIKDSAGVWHDWASGGLTWDGYAYLNGNEYTDITGGWEATSGNLQKNFSYNGTSTMKISGTGINTVIKNKSAMATKGMTKITIVYDNMSNSNAEQSFFYLKNESLEIVDTFVINGQGTGNNKVATLNIPSNCKNCYVVGSFNEGKMEMISTIYIESVKFSR